MNQFELECAIQNLDNDIEDLLNQIRILHETLRKMKCRRKILAELYISNLDKSGQN